MKQLITYFFILLISSCNYNSKEISKPEIHVDSTDKSLNIFENRISLLSAIKEDDSISTYGAEVYRLFLITPFNPLIVFRLVTNDSSFKLTTKLFYIKQADGQGSDTLISQKEIILSEKDAILITREIYSAMIWNLKSDNKRCVLDASYWEIECYDKSREDTNSLFNHVVLYSRKTGPLKNIFRTLIQAANLKLQYYE